MAEYEITQVVVVEAKSREEAIEKAKEYFAWGDFDITEDNVKEL